MSDDEDVIGEGDVMSDDEGVMSDADGVQESGKGPFPANI